MVPRMLRDFFEAHENYRHDTFKSIGQAGHSDYPEVIDHCQSLHIDSWLRLPGYLASWYVNILVKIMGDLSWSPTQLVILVPPNSKSFWGCHIIY